MTYTRTVSRARGPKIVDEIHLTVIHLRRIINAGHLFFIESSVGLTMVMMMAVRILPSALVAFFGVQVPACNTNYNKFIAYYQHK